MKTTTNSKASILQELQALVYAKAEKNLGFYFKQAWKVLEPSTELLLNWHHALITEYLQAAMKGEIKRLIINVPPRSGKSNLITVTFPTWAWIHDPSMRFIFTSYSGSLSTKHSVDRRTLIESFWYQQAWGTHYQLSTDQNVKTEFQNTRRGHMIATSMSGTATGKGGNILIVDDPHDTTRAQSEVKRESDIRDFDQKFTSRLDNKKEGVIIVVMQRLHERDLTGHLLAQKSWEHLSLPAEAPKKTTIIFPLSKKEIVREEGAILHEKREGRAELDGMKKALGSAGYAGQYLQQPSPAEGAIIKRNWFKFYKVLPDNLNSVLQSWDCSFKDTSVSDFVVGTVWGKSGSGRYLLDLVRGRMGLVSTLAAIRSLSAKWPQSGYKLIEDKANGPAVIDTLKSEIQGIIAVNPQSSKEARLQAVSPQIEAGNVYLPDPSIAPWVHDFIEEVCTFPRSAHDDQLDSMTQALDRLSDKRRPTIHVLD